MFVFTRSYTMKIDRLPSGSYRFQKQINGKRHSFTFDHKPTKKEIEQAVYEKMNSNITLSTASGRTFEECAEEYIKIKANVLSPSSIRGYKSVINNMSSYFLGLTIGSIDQLAVQKEINDYSVSHSPKSTRNLHGFISSVLKMFNPGLVLHTTLPQQEKAKDGYIPTSDEIRSILKESENTVFFIPFSLACYGMRRSEICALKYPDDFDGNIVHITKALVLDENNVPVLKSTKTTGSERDIVIDDRLLSEIEKAGVVYDGYPNSLPRALRRYQLKLGIEHFRFHDLRHYFATELSHMNIPEEDILAMGGWTSPYTMKRVYRHNRILEDTAAKKDISNKIANGIFGS